MLLLGISKVFQNGLILDKKEFELSQSCLAARAAARRSLQGGVCTTREPPQPPPPAPWNIPCSQDDQLCPRQKLHSPSSTWTNREFTVPPKKGLSFSFRPPCSTSPFQSLSREAKSLFCRSQGASAPNPLLTHTIARSELLD